MISVGGGPKNLGCRGGCDGTQRVFEILDFVDWLCGESRTLGDLLVVVSGVADGL